ncbi:hypothetical protein F4819DRAFT_68116 [Hypoxylon fuscum]|nr:hypothetical protein F4819DRAFT_68116 [Hypoxylon fuscum]
MAEKTGAEISGLISSFSSLALSSDPPPSPPAGYSPLRRRPTDSSYYDFNGTPWDNQDPDSQDWIYASEARQQQATVPVGTARPYPSAFRNGEDLPL